MSFLNRTAELNALHSALSRKRKQFIVVYGRRRCGKSTLLRQLPEAHTCYFLATEGEPALQRSLLAKQLGSLHAGFELSSFASWSALLTALVARRGERYTLILDEFPYLVRAAPELASTLQALLEDRERLPFDLIVCGSSQQMMEDAVLSASAPLYGRADEILRVEPLAAGYLREQFPNLSPSACIEEYAVWGGVPRYWELRDRYASLAEAIQQLLLSRTGLLNDEPRRLLLDDFTKLASPLSLLTLIASGANRVSELGGRLEKTSADLTRPLSRLVELGYVTREVPFGESPRRSKRTLYTVRDSFMRFYYRFVISNASRLEAGRSDEVWSDIEQALPHFVGSTWEELCRQAVQRGACGLEFDDCKRWWGTTTDRQPLELDGVARSRDGKKLLLLECKWSMSADAAAEINRLNSLARQLPFYKGEEVVIALGLKASVKTKPAVAIITPELVLTSLH